MYNADIAQLVERVIGNDEVPGPNPGISSRKPLRVAVSRVFGGSGNRFFIPASISAHLQWPLTCAAYTLHVYAFLFRCANRFAFSSYTLK